MDFGKALEALKFGNKVARSGWNGKGMFLFLVKPVEIEYKKALPTKYDSIEHLESIAMKTADDKIQMGWIPSQLDMFAKDWCIIS